MADNMKQWIMRDLNSEVLISPSILSADFAKLKEEVEAAEQAGADWIHVDVMDGHFVPNITMGIPVVKALAATTKLPIDVHMMVSNPIEQLPWFLKHDISVITLHCETASNEELMEAIQSIRSAGVHPALSIKPKTPLSDIEPFIDYLDMILVMSVEPGFSSQSYIEGSEDRIAELKRLCEQHGVSPLIEVDGGISPQTAKRVVQAGAHVLVCGNAVFSKPDYAQAIADVRNACL